MKNTPWPLLALALIGASLFSTTPQAFAAPSKVSSTKEKPASSAPANAPTRPTDFKGLPKKAAPARKGGKETKDLTYTVHIYSRTDDYVDVFIDGDFTGTVGG